MEIASSSPAKSKERIGRAYTAIPSDEGMARSTVNRKASDTTRTCPSPARDSMAAESCGTSDSATGVTSAGIRLNTGTAKVVYAP